MLQGLGARAVTAPGQVTPLDFTPTQAGTFQMTCGMNMFGPGTLIVTE
ncbi:MAG: cupredoxin domain-containing protein [Chloroflexota bacterium]|nr:cupredoxin domain-containing protein [Chloroflexota bacterium]